MYIIWTRILLIIEWGSFISGLTKHDIAIAYITAMMNAELRSNFEIIKDTP